MIFEENVNYYKKMKVPVRAIKNIRRESINPQKGINFGLFKQSLKRAGRILLILAFLSAQVYLASAFEAHVINVTAQICNPAETRTMGFWKNHPNFYKDCLPVTLGNYPLPDITLNNKPDVDEIFDAADADVMIDMLRGQLLAMKFNICYFIDNDTEGEEFDGMTLSEIVAAADNLLRNSDATREELEEMKNLLDYLNNLHQVRYCAKQSGNSSEGFLAALSEEYSVGWVSSYLFVSDDAIDEEEAPETFITAHPQSESTFSDAYFSFGSSKRNVTFQCKLSSKITFLFDWRICDSPTTYYALPPGDYRFHVFATDNKEKYDRTPAVFSWTITEAEELAEEPPVEELPLAPEPEPYCGDGNIDDGEECDDGNIEDGDGCSANCILEVGEGSEPEPPVEPGPSCGDGIIDEGEQCDDGNIEDGDGCSVSCATEEVLPPVTECEPEAQQVCSTGLLGICEAGTQICSSEGFWGECLQDEELVAEVCDDELDNDCNGLTDCDDESCFQNPTCQEPEPTPYCGDGNLDDGEECDAGENNGVECTSEYGSSCDYCSLTCETITATGSYCGDGNLDESYEECDDGNTEDGDGCSASCTLEEVLPPVTECEPDAQQVCSTGLLGICGAGTQTCDLEGFWGECLQDNQPTDEVCNNGLDDNCDGNIDCDDSSCLEDESCLPPVE